MLNKLQLLGRAVKQAQHRQHRLAESRLTAIGTTLVQWDALRAISRMPGASAHTLALATFQTDQAFGTLANRLLAQGLIDRCAGHGRRIEHRLTSAGETLLGAGSSVVDGVLAELFSTLNESEQKSLYDLLVRVIGDAAVNLHESDAEAADHAG